MVDFGLRIEILTRLLDGFFGLAYFGNP